MSRVVAVIQARMSSSRLPGKVMMPLGEMVVLGWCVRAARAISGVDEVVVATSDDASDDAVAAWCARESVMCVRGSLHDVLGRFVQAVKMVDASVVLRLTADCPLLDPDVCGGVLALMQRGGYDYVNNVTPRQWPVGLDCEAFTATALYAADAQAKTAYEREHVTPWIRDHQYRFKVGTLDCPLPRLQDARWTLDYQEDYDFLQKIVPHVPQDRAPSYLEVLRAITLSGAEDFKDGVVKGNGILPEYVGFSQSETLYHAAADSVAQALPRFSVGQAPLFLTHGRGGCVWDVDGHDYVDMVGGALPRLLGYADPDVDAAIRKQLHYGVGLSLPTVSEVQLTAYLRDMILCAQSVRYGAHGAEVTAAAIELARAFTGRERVMRCCIHNRQLGAAQEVIDSVAYDDIAAVDALLLQHRGAYAALLMEPVQRASPHEGYFKALHALLKKHGVLLIFDEVDTGFRISAGGAQEYFGVAPDLTCLGNAMANGLPLCALMGRADVMAATEHRVFSGMIGGDALSLAAAVAVCEKIQAAPVIDTLWRHGAFLREGITALIAQYDLQDVVALQGLDPSVMIEFLPQDGVSSEAMQAFFTRKMARCGVLIFDAHHVCYAHTEHDLERVLMAYEAVLPALAAAIKSKNLEP